MIAPRLVYAFWRSLAQPAERSFRRALRRPAEAQSQLLRRLLRRQAKTRVGQRFGFSAIDSIESFRRRVPLTSYDDYRDDINAIRRGERNVLTAEPVTRLVPSSGSTAGTKLIPFTPWLQRAFGRAVAPWIVDLLRRYPELVGGPAYWSVSPAFEPHASASRVPIGFDGDESYLGGFLAPWVGSVLLAPNALRRSRSLAAFQYATLLWLVAEEELRLVSVWHPSFWTLLWTRREAHWSQLIDDIEKGTLTPPEPLGDGVHRALERKLRPRPERAWRLRDLGAAPSVVELWPRLQVVSAWADAAAASAASSLAQRIAPVPLEAKGLLATEACITIPYRGLHPIALRSHYFEFLDESGEPFEAHELEAGRRYEVVVTTQGGLYRYRLGDRVLVEGFLDATPSLRFVGRADSVVDLVGEKLNDAFVHQALTQALESRSAPRGFAMLAADGAASATPGQSRGYTLYIDASVADEPSALLGALEQALRLNPHYAYARDLGQLDPLSLFRVEGDAAAAALEIDASGRTLGSVKPQALSQRDDWSSTLRGHYVLHGSAGEAGTEKLGEGTMRPERRPA